MLERAPAAAPILLASSLWLALAAILATALPAAWRLLDPRNEIEITKGNAWKRLDVLDAALMSVSAGMIL